MIKTLRVCTLSLVSALAFFSADTFAEGMCFNCTVKTIGIGPHYDELCTTSSGRSMSCAFVKVAGAFVNRPTCSGDWNYVIDTSTQSGRNALALLLTANASGKTVQISGTGVCSFYSQSENFFYAQILSE